jgi:ArsR family transcriptional regulator
MKNEDKIPFSGGSAVGEAKTEQLSELFKVFGDSTRLRILFSLMESEKCVTDMSESLDMTASAISHQLKVLKQADLVRGRREGKMICYALADDHVKTIIGQGWDHINE